MKIFFFVCVTPTVASMKLYVDEPVVIVQFILKFPKVVICDHNRFKTTAVKAATEKYNLTGLYDLLGRRYSFLQPSYDV